MTLSATSLRWSRAGNLVVDDVTIDPVPGETIGLLGLVSQAASPLRPIDHIWTPRSISTAALHGTPG